MGRLSGPGYRESTTRRWKLAPAKPLPTLVAFDGWSLRVIAPWAKGTKPTESMTADFEAASVTAQIAWQARELPSMCWICGSTITPITGQSDPAWLQRMLHDRHAIELLPQAAARPVRPAIDRMTLGPENWSLLQELAGSTAP